MGHYNPIKTRYSDIENYIHIEYDPVQFAKLLSESYGEESYESILNGLRVRIGSTIKKSIEHLNQSNS